MPVALSTAVTVNDGYDRISDCSMCEPSLDAKYLCSFTNCMNAETKLAPGTFSASSWICSSRSSLGCSGISNGFFSTGVFQWVSYGSTGASRTGSRLMARLAFAMPTACAATRAISSLLTTLLLAKPHVPSTIRRMPKP